MADTHNGPFSGLGNQQAVDPAAAARHLAAQQLSQLSLALYSHAIDLTVEQDCEEIARRSHRAARSYFTGLGLALFPDTASGA